MLRLARSTLLLLAGCGAATRTIDAGADAAPPDVTLADTAQPDSAPPDAPPEASPPDALCVPHELRCNNGTTRMVSCPRSPSGVEWTPLGASLSFCRCLHGAGPGLEGTVSLRVRNVSTTPVRVGLDAQLHLTATDGAVPTLGPCCTQHFSLAPACGDEATPWLGLVEPGHFEELSLAVHVDSDVTAPGDYTGVLVVQLDGHPLNLLLGTIHVGTQ